MPKQVLGSLTKNRVMFIFPFLKIKKIIIICLFGLLWWLCATFELVFYKNKAALQLCELLVEICKSASDVWMESVEESDNAHHTERYVLSEFAVLKIFLDGWTDTCWIKGHCFFLSILILPPLSKSQDTTLSSTIFNTASKYIYVQHASN